jgi:hypothetical protein
MVNEDPATRWARDQIEEIFTNAGLPYLPDPHTRTRPTRAPVVACLLATAAVFLFLVILTFLVGG